MSPGARPAAIRAPGRRRKPILKHPSDMRQLAFLSAYYAMMAFLWRKESIFFGHGPAGWLLWLVAWGSQLFLAAIAAVVNHNALHVPVFNNMSLQRVLQLAISLACAQPASVYQPAHNRSHHRHAGTRQDVFRASKMRFPSEKNWLNMLLAREYTPGQKTGASLIVSYYLAQWHAGNRAPVLTVLNEFAFVNATQLLALYFAPRRAILYLIIPMQTAVSFITFINYCQHDGCDVDPHQEGVNFARNFTGFWFNFFTMNNGYHAAHHLKPGLHWAALKAEHEKRVKPHMHPALDEPDFVRYLWRAMWTRDDYLGRPVQLPPAEDDADEAIDFWSHSSYELQGFEVEEPSS